MPISSVFPFLVSYQKDQKKKADKLLVVGNQTPFLIQFYSGYHVQKTEDSKI